MLGLLVAGTGVPPVGAAETAQLRIAHLSPDSPAVDVALAPLPPGTTGPLTDPGDDLVTGLSYGALSDAVDLAPGGYAVSVRAAGADRTVPPVLSARVDLPPGAARTVTLSGAFADLALQTLVDDLSAPPPDSARVRVLAAAGTVPALDVVVQDGPSLAVDLPLGAAGRAETVAAGPAVLVVSGGAAATQVPVSFAAASVVTVLVLDSPDGGLLVRPVVDAAGPAVVPAGGVDAGTGPPSSGALLPALLLAGLAAAPGGRVLLTVAATAVAVVVSPGAAAPAPSPIREGAPVPVAVVPGPAAPARLVVPAAGVDAALTGAGLDARGALVPPSDTAVAGWYAGGPRPGETGPAVVTGHVDWAGAPGVFSRLAAVGAGAEIRVVRADGSTARFAVTRVERYAKDDFPTAEVYAPTSGADLRLITCGGAFDRARGSYEDNVVVFARAVP